MKINLTDRILSTIEDRDGVGVTVAVIAAELKHDRDSVAEALEAIYWARPFKLIKTTQGDWIAYSWEEGKQGERYCVCGDPWWQHEGAPGTECMAKRCNCGLFRDNTNETETCEMSEERDLERDLALAYMDVLLATKLVMAHFGGRMGWGRMPAKTIDFESAKPDKKARCIKMLTYQKRYAEILLAEIENREDEKPKAVAAEDPEQTDIADGILDSPPEHAVIVWHPDEKAEMRERVSVTQIDDGVYLVRHLANGGSETLFQGNSWEDLVYQVSTKKHRLELVEETGDSEFEDTAPGDVAATAPAVGAE